MKLKTLAMIIAAALIAAAAFLPVWGDEPKMPVPAERFDVVYVQTVDTRKLMILRDKDTGADYLFFGGGLAEMREESGQ